MSTNPTSRQSQSRSLTAVALLAAAMTAVAQKGKAPAASPSAPLPSQIQTGTRVFLSNLCSAGQSTCTDIYNDLYAGLVKQGKYTLVASPSLADLVFEIHYNTRLTDVTGTGSSGPNSLQTTALQLVFLDRITRIALWSFTEPESRKVRATDKVLADLQQLLTAFQTAGTSATRSPAVGNNASGAQQAQ